MKLRKSFTIASVLALTTMTSPVTFADESGWYIGGNVGQSRARLNELKIVNDVIPLSFNSTTFTENSIDGGYKLYGGYQLNRYLSLEGGYFDLGDFQFVHNTVPAGPFATNMQVRGVNLDLVGSIPFTEKLSAFARLGANYALTQNTFTGSGAVAPASGKIGDKDTYPKAGVGLQYKFSDAVALRIESERYRIGNALTDHNHVDLFSVGVVYRFGTTKKSTVTSAPVAAPVAAPTPRFEKTTLSAKELFEFDKAEVTPAQPELETLANTLKGSTAPKQVKVVGHTDRLGSDEYNQRLSERRAEAVKNYIVEKGVEPDRVVAEGKVKKNLSSNAPIRIAPNLLSAYNLTVVFKLTPLKSNAKLNLKS